MSSVDEGQSAQFTVTLAGASAGSAAAITVPYTISGLPSGVTPTDANSGSITIAAGDTSGDITIGIPNVDTQNDQSADSTLSVNLGTTATVATGGGAATRGSPRSATVMVDWQSAAHSIALTSPARTITETDADATTTYTLTRSGPDVMSGMDIVVTWTVTHGSTNPTVDADFSSGSAPSGTVTFSGATTSRTFPVGIEGDNRNEADETFTITFSIAAANQAAVTANGEANLPDPLTVTITDDDPVLIAVTRNPDCAASVAENVGNCNFRVSVTGGIRASGVSAVVPFTISGTGITNADYDITLPASIAATATGGSLTIPQADASADIRLAITDDDLNEATETLAVTGAPAGASGLRLTGTAGTYGAVEYSTGDNTDSVMVTDNDAITVSIANPTPATQDEGSTILFPVSFAGATSGSAAAIEVAYTVDWTAASTGTFMVLDEGSPLTIAAGDTMGNIRVRVQHSIPLDSNSPDEMLSVTLGAITVGTGGGSATGSGSGTVTVNWIDAAHTIEVADATVDEGAATITVTRSASMDLVQAVDIMYEVTVGGPGATHATAADFSGGLPSGTVTFSGSQETATINLPIIDDNLAEMAETFTLTLSENIDMATQTANSVVAAADSATVTITDNDNISIRIGGPRRVSEERTVTFPVTLSAQPSVALSMTWTVAAATTISRGTLASSCAAPSDMVAAVTGDFATGAGTSAAPYPVATSFPTDMLNFGVGVTTANIEFSTSAGAQSTAPTGATATANANGYDQSCDRWFTITLSAISGGGGTTDAMATNMSVTILLTEDNPEAITALNEAVLPEVARAVVVNQVSALAERVGQAAGGGAVFTPSFNLNGGADSLAEMAAKNARDWAKDDGLDTKELLRDMDFVMPFSAADGALGNRMALWGGSDYRDFKGEDDATEWDGEMFSFHLGADARVNERLLVGVMVTHSDAESDYQFDDNGRTSRGDYDLEMTGFSPYLSWDLGDAGSAWFSAGYGQGDLTIDPDDVGDDTLTSDVDMTSFSAGGARALRESGAHELRLKGDVFMASVDVDGDDSNPNLTAVEVDASRARLLVESRHKFALASGAQLTPLVDMGARYDGGDGQTGSGLELGGGMHYFDPAIGLTAEARARVLIGHSADQDEWGVGGVVRLAPGADGQGLSLALTPSYGDAESDAQGMWDNGVARAGSAAKSAADPAATLAAEVGYGMPATMTDTGLFAGEGLLTPYSALRFGDNNDYRVGLRWTAEKRLSLDMSARHLDTDNRLTLEGKLKF